MFRVFGEASEGVHELIQTMADSRVKGVGLKRGSVSKKAELGVVVGKVSRLLSGRGHGPWRGRSRRWCGEDNSCWSEGQAILILSCLSSSQDWADIACF